MHKPLALDTNILNSHHDNFESVISVTHMDMMRLLLATSICVSSVQLSPPHIVTIVVDDLGWGDVPWNNPESPAVHLGR